VSTTPRTEDPRAIRSRSAILDAARRLLQQEGPAAVTHLRVAAEAGVGRATVYRHWPDPAALLSEAMSQVPLPFFTDYDHDLPGWLTEQLRRLADELTVPAVRQVTATLVQTAQWDPEARTQLQRWLQAITRRLHRALSQAASNGEPTPHADASDVTTQLLAPIVFRAIFEGEPVSDQLLHQAVAAVLAQR
jgi:AcrR family transcriptional regulator